MGSFGYGYAILFTCFGAIYPVIALVLLTRPAARAACAEVEEPDLGFGLDRRDSF